MKTITTVGELRRYIAPYADDTRLGSSYDGRPAVVSTSMLADCETHDPALHRGCPDRDLTVIFITEADPTPEAPTVLHQLTIEVTRTLTEKATLHWLDLTEDEARTASLLIQTAGVDRAVAEIERVVRPYDDLNPSEYQVVSTVLDGESTFQAGPA